MGEGDDHVTVITGCDGSADSAVSECASVPEGCLKTYHSGDSSVVIEVTSEPRSVCVVQVTSGVSVEEVEEVEEWKRGRLAMHEEEEDYICDFLDKSNDEAEARLAARRQARAEARDIRMRELERQQKEIEESADRVYDMHTEPVSRPARVAAAAVTPRLAVSTSLTANNSYHSSRRSSEDSLEEVGNIRDIRIELKLVEDKFRTAMIQNAQLDNEKAALNYQVELMKDRLDELDESHCQLQREHRDECRLHAALKRDHTQLKEEATWTRTALDERDALIAGYGLQIVGGEDGEKRALVTVDNATMLYSVGQGSLDVRLRRLAEDRDDLADQVRRLQLELEEGRSQRRSGSQSVPTVNGGVGLVEVEEAQRETNKLLADYRFKLQKAEQDVATLQASVARLESQVVRYKGASESSEKVEDELKVEKRKLQREGDEADIGDDDVNNDVNINNHDADNCDVNNHDVDNCDLNIHDVNNHGVNNDDENEDDDDDGDEATTEGAAESSGEDDVEPSPECSSTSA